MTSQRFAGSLAVALGNLSAALCETGALDEALQAARESAALQELEGTLWVNLDPFALLALRRGRIEAAALALGCVEARFAREGYPRQPNEQRQREELVLRLRQALPSAQLEQLLAQGAALRTDEAVRLVLAD